MTAFSHPSPIYQHRRALVRTRAALAAGKLSVGFLGGSITAPHVFRNWPEPLLAWLVERYPHARIAVENAAIGATGSDLAAFRAGPTVIAAGCDLVFVEFAVNDLGHPSDLRNRMREGVLRQLLAAGCDVVLAYTFSDAMQADMAAGRVPPSIAEYEALAAHYGIGSVWMSLHAWHEVHAGRMTWHEWLPDGLHPENRGSLSYAQSVIAFCEREFAAAAVPAASARSELPAPMHAGCWETVSVVPWADIRTEGPWTLRRWYSCYGIDQALYTTAPGAALRFTFAGRGLVLGFDFGRFASEVRYRVDGGAWQVTNRDRPAWAGDRGWLRPVIVADTLAPGRHEFELETLAAPFPGNCGTVTTLGLVGVIG